MSLRARAGFNKPFAAALAALCLCALPCAAIEPAASPDPTILSLPDEPGLALAAATPIRYSTSFVPAVPRVVTASVTAPQTPLSTRELDAACQTGTLRGKPCKIQWLPLLWESFEATAVETAGNVTFDNDTRIDITHNAFWDSYLKCVHQYRYRQWSDDTPFIVHNIGHPMQGATVYSIYAQNDPKSRGLLFTNNGNYWRGKFKAMAVVTLYEVQWKIGPISEASIGNSGLNTYFTPDVIGRSTNETGFQDFVITPVYGLAWNITEDLVDRYVMPRIWRRTHNKLLLSLLMPLTPARDSANLVRYKPFYYRDYDLTPLR